MFGPCFVVQYLVSFLVLHLSRWDALLLFFLDVI